MSGTVIPALIVFHFRSLLLQGGFFMALFDGGFKIGTGLLVGVGAILLAPVVIPAAAAVIRPVAKAAIKGGFVLYQKGREAIAETVEMFEDIAAEAKAELIEEHEAEIAAVAPAGEAVDAS